MRNNMYSKPNLWNSLLIVALILCSSVDCLSQTNLKLDRVFYLTIDSEDFTKVDIPDSKVWEVKNFLYSTDKSAPNKDRVNNISMLLIKYKGVEFKGVSSSNYTPLFLASNESVGFKVLPFKDYGCSGLLTIFEYTVE